MKIEEVLEKKVNNIYDVEVEELALLIKNKIEKKKTKFQGYDATDVNFNKSDVIEIFEKYATQKHHGGTKTVSLKLFIKAMISYRVEENGKQRIAKSLLSKVESFFKEDI